VTSLPRIVILTGNHICHNPRAFKEAEALAAANYDVLWLGGWFDKDRAERDRKLLAEVRWKFQPVCDWTEDWRGSLTRQRQRLRRKLAATVFERFKIESPEQLGYNVKELSRAALAQPAVLYIAHSESGMWVAQQLLAHGRSVGIDMEDWFSEDMPSESRRGRPVEMIRNLEGTLLTNASYNTCTSRAMSQALVEAYQCRPPTVIYNAFPWSERQNLDGKVKDRRGKSTVSVHWFSQTIAPGRGLEDLFGALPLVEGDVEIHLRGAIDPANENWLERSVAEKWRGSISIHPIVRNDELLSRVAEHDIGLALEPNHPPNKNLTVSNKLLQYLTAGLAVIASNTAGHVEIATETRTAVSLYQAGESQSLAAALNVLIRNGEMMVQAKTDALEAAQKTFAWEKIGEVLVERVRKALE
jgi:glycosyltransferase involved in cell wall biosynthesis